MYAQFFGNYLLSRNAVTKEQFMQVIQKTSAEKIKLGTLAIHAGYMTANEVDRVIIMQTHQDKRFGELAIQEGYLTDNQVAELLKAQKHDFLLLGQILVNDGILSNQQLQDLIIDYQSENEIYEFNYSDESKDSIKQLIENFFVITERALSEYEISFLRLLFNNLVRFIGDDFTLAAPSLCKEYPSNYCVHQDICGSLSIKTYIDMPETACVSFASRYVNDTFTEFDEYVQASLDDFLNLHNGLYTVNMSNDFSIELQLEPPVTESAELLNFDAETYLLPVIYPFGTIHFMIQFPKL